MPNPQFETYEYPLAVGETKTFTAGREPERWIVYPVDNTFSGNVAVLPGGSLPASGCQRLFAYTRLVVPGVTAQITVRNQGNKTVPLVVTAVSDLPFEVERLAQGGEQGNPDRGGRMRNSADYSVVSGSESFWSFGTVDYDTDNMCSLSPNNRLNINTPGKYFLYAQVAWGVNNSGAAAWHYLYLWRNQTQILAMDRHKSSAAPGTIGETYICSTTWPLAAGDYIQAVVYQEIGVNRVLQAAPGYSAILGAQRLAG